VLWYALGYSIAFGTANAWFGGFDRAFLGGVAESSQSGTLPETVFLMFQMTFAIITPALIVGGVAERTRFSAVMIFTALWLLLVYAPVTHWVWGGGWLQQMGLLDFAGGTVVHITAGVAALVSALVIGNRNGFGVTAMPPHNMTMTVTGAGMLWVGWFGFNAGSALAANGDAGMAMLVTHLSAAAGALTWLGIEWIRFGKPSALGAVTGLVAGLGTITPASGYVGPAAALLIGTMAGTVCFFATQGLKRVLKIDDSLDVFPVHGVGGILGTLAAGIFASSELGFFSGQGLAGGRGIGAQLLVQACGVAAVGLYTALMTWIVLRVTGVLVALRVSAEEETEGLDVVLHNERGYDL
jgi:Amt family ammonium transporter